MKNKNFKTVVFSGIITMQKKKIIKKKLPETSTLFFMFKYFLIPCNKAEACELYIYSTRE